MNPQVKTFHDPVTSTFTHVVYDSAGGHAAIVDPVLDYDAASARTSTTSADEVLAFVRAQSLTVEWILETHAHADHLTAASYLKQETGARVVLIRYELMKPGERLLAYWLQPTRSTSRLRKPSWAQRWATSCFGWCGGCTSSSPARTAWAAVISNCLRRLAHGRARPGCFRPSCCLRLWVPFSVPFR